jgi:hypothetical protein
MGAPALRRLVPREKDASQFPIRAVPLAGFVVRDRGHPQDTEICKRWKMEGFGGFATLLK